MHGICCVTYPEFVRNGSLIGKNIGLFPLKNHLSIIEIRDNETFKKFSKILKNTNQATLIKKYKILIICGNLIKHKYFAIKLLKNFQNSNVIFENYQKIFLIITLYTSLKY